MWATMLQDVHFENGQVLDKGEIVWLRVDGFLLVLPDNGQMLDCDLYQECAAPA